MTTTKPSAPTESTMNLPPVNTKPAPMGLRATQAYRKLGVAPSQLNAYPRITQQLSKLWSAIRRVTNCPVDPYYYLSVSEDPVAVKITEIYQGITKYYRTVLPIEAYAVAAGTTPQRVFEIIAATCIRISNQESAVIAAVSHPRVVEKTIEMALMDDGIEDRTLLHRATGFLPAPKGSQTTISINQQQNAPVIQQVAVHAPPPENTIKRLVDRFNDFRALPPQPPTPPAAEIEEAEVVDVSSESDEDD